MSRKSLRTMLATAATILALAPASAQYQLPEFQKTETLPIVGGHQLEAATAGSAATAATTGEASANLEASQHEQAPQPAACETVEKLMRDNNLRFKAPAPYVPAESEQEHPLTFIGSLQVAFYGPSSYYTPYGMYKFSSKDGFKREPVGHIDGILNSGATYAGNKLVGFSGVTIPPRNDGRQYYNEIDVDTWIPTAKSMTRVLSEQISKLAYDPVTKKIYSFIGSDGTSSNSSNFAVFDMDSQTYETLLPDVPVNMFDVRAIAFNSKGECFILNSDSELQKYDMDKGTLSTVLTFSEKMYFALQSMTFDERDLLYLCVSIGSQDDGMSSAIFEINTDEATYRIVGYLPEGEEYTALRVVYEPEDGCPGAISDLNATFTGTTTTGNVSFTMPSTTVGGSTLTSDITYTLYVDDEQTANATAQAGAAVSEPMSVAEEGLHKVVVVLKNDAGEGLRNVATAFAGKDTPMASDLTLTITDGMAQVSWNADRGEWNGYVDKSAQTFDVVRMPDGVKVAKGITETSFSEPLADMPYAGYSYQVRASIGEQVGKTVQSNVVRYGKPYETPYTDGINNEYDINNFEVIDQNGDGNTWQVMAIQEYSEDWNYRLLYAVDHSNKNSADDWAIMPPIHMKEGYAYRLNMKASSFSENKPERLEVAYGQGNDPSAFSQLMEPTLLGGTLREMKDITLDAKIKAEGDYRFGFHAMSDAHMSTLSIDQINVVEVAALEAPDSIYNMTATPATEGELTATVEFNAPTKTFEGEALNSISKIELIRNGEEVATTLTTVQPGQHVTMTDEDAVNGFTTYSVIVYNDKGQSIPVERTIYVGIDAPFEPRNPIMIDNLDGTATMEWEAPLAEGQNGGYVEVDELLYNTYRVSQGEGIVPVGEDVEGTAFMFDDIEQPDDQRMSYYAVEAYNEIGQSELVQAPMVIGKAHELPFMEGFIGGSLTELWWVEGSEYKNTFNMSTGMSADGDNSTSYYQAKEPGNHSTLHSGKISIKGAENPTLVFAYYDMPGVKNMLEVAVRKNGGKESDKLFSLDFSTESGNTAAWKYQKISLADYKDSEYLLFDITATINDEQNPIVLFDDMNVRDMKDNDLTVSATAQRHVQAGETAKVSATVHNIGDNAAEGYTVNLYVNDQLAETVSGKKLESFNRQTYSFNYQTKRNDPATSLVRVEVAWDADQMADNNSSGEQEMLVADPLLNKVENLKGEAEGIVAMLNWDAVSVENNVVESFETYATFLTKDFGQWTTNDADGGLSMGISGVSDPNANTAYAWQTFDFGSAGIDLDANPDFRANTGTQFVVSMRPNTWQTDDWLISPELSGKTQTVSFYARTMGGYFDDNVEVYASSKSDGIEDFEEKVGSVSLSPYTNTSWSKYEYELPEGTMHFAIRNNSFYGGFVMVDDISYEGRELTLKGYNIYRDGELIATVGASDTAYQDNEMGDGSHTYNITAVFEEGESGFSNDAEVSGATGIDNRQWSMDNAQWSKFDLQGRRLNVQQRGVNILRNGNNVRKVIKK